MIGESQAHRRFVRKARRLHGQPAIFTFPRAVDVPEMVEIQRSENLPTLRQIVADFAADLEPALGSGVFAGALGFCAIGRGACPLPGTALGTEARANS